MPTMRSALLELPPWVFSAPSILLVGKYMKIWTKENTDLEKKSRNLD
jgi:hypothetical protein